MNNQNKTKYFLEIAAFALVFWISAFPVFAGEINVESVLKLTNTARESWGLAGLVQNEKLMSAAEEKLNNMIENNYFAHTSPSGFAPWHWFEKAGYNYQYAGENLAINFLTAENQHKAWMESPTHRKNILNPNYREIGIAIGAGEIDGEMSIVTVQEFGAQIGAADAPGGKNFSSGEDKNLLKDEGQIVPQVLSVKDSEKVNVSPKEQVPQNVWANKLAVMDLALALAALLFAASLALIPLVFLSVATEKIFILWEQRKENSEALKAA